MAKLGVLAACLAESFKSIYCLTFDFFYCFSLILNPTNSGTTSARYLIFVIYIPKKPQQQKFKLFFLITQLIFLLSINIDISFWFFEHNFKSLKARDVKLGMMILMLKIQ